MPGHLSDQLQRSLGSAFTIVRELGGGGMSRVFLADDTSLGRSVVIKVLLPELAAGVNADRFKREVQLSARLQHPHIVPVLSAGDVDGLPYYIMPYVKGESLRARLAAGPLPVAEVMSTLVGVAKALAYAQSEGIVHRDIKPDNILLSGGAATVADFGIAKAISTSRQSEQGETLTSLGMSLGTPAYMAPEQVAGDPNVDHRADIYSLGCVAYEMLSGHSPFAGKSPQQILAAQIAEKPAPLAELRAGIPSALIALIDRCLEKDPQARPQSAGEIAERLEASGARDVTDTAPRAHRSTLSSPLAIGAAVLLVVAAAVATYRFISRPRTAEHALSVAVAPFEVLDPALALWKEGMVDVLSRNLDGAGPIRSVPPNASIKRWDGHADRTTALEFGKRLGAQLVVYGQLQSAGRDLVDARAWIVDAERGGNPVELDVRDSTSRMDRVTDSLSVRLLAAIGRERPIGAARVASFGSGSLPAVKAFLQGAQFFRRTRWDSAATAFRLAISLDSTFGIAYMHLAQTLGWSRGGDPEVNVFYGKAGQFVRPGLSPHDSLLLTAVRHYAGVTRTGSRSLPETRLAVNTGEVAAQRYPDDPEVWYLLGDMRYHGDPTVSDREALTLFDHAIAADSDFAPAYIHAIELAYRYGADVGGRYAAAYLRRDPTDVEGEGIRLAALAADPRAPRQDIQKQLDTLAPGVVAKVYAAVQRLPDSAETAVILLRTGVRRAPNANAAQQLSAMLANQLAMRGHIKEAWAIGVRTRNPVVAEIALLGLVPADTAARQLKPWLSKLDQTAIPAIPALAMARDTLTLLAQIPEIARLVKKDTSGTGPAILKYFTDEIHGYVALVRGDTASAARLFDALSDTLIHVPVDQFMRARLIGRTDPRRALSLLEQRIPYVDLLYPARELERGRLAEKLGERERAVDAYSFVAAIWHNAESPQLRDGAREASDALKRLDSDGRVRAQFGRGVKS